LDIKGQNGKRGKQEEYDDAEVTEKNKKEDLDEMIKQNNKKIKDAKEKMDNAKLDEFKDKYKKEYEDALKEAKREQEKLETELEQKTQDKETKKGILEKAQKKLEAYKPGVERQQQYAKTLEEEKTIDTAFIKVSRKHKIASLKIKKNIKVNGLRCWLVILKMLRRNLPLKRKKRNMPMSSIIMIWCHWMSRKN